MGRKDRKTKKEKVRNAPFGGVSVDAPARVPSPLVLLFVLVSVGFIVYSNTFNASFQLDDETSITSNEHIQHLNMIGTIWRHWPSRFLTYLSLAINYHIGKEEVFGYHAVNLTLHLVVTLLVFWFMGLLFRTPLLREHAPPSFARLYSFLTALLFTAHPLQTQGVTYICQRAVTLASVFYLLTLCGYIKSRLAERAEGQRAGRSQGWRFFSWLTCLVAMFTKEWVVTLPFMIWIVERFFISRGEKTPWKRLLPYFGITLVLPLTMAVTRSVDFIHMRKADEPIPNDSWWEYFVTELRVMVTYIRLLFFPVNQMLDYDYPLYKTIFAAPTFLSLVGLIAVAWAAVRQRARQPLIAFGTLWFFLTLFPESGMVPIRDVIFEHRLYLPMLGFSCAVVGVVFLLLGRRGWRLPTAVLLAAAVAFGIAAYRRNLVWRSQMEMWQDVAKKAPRKARAYKGIGFEYEKLKRFDKALEAYEQAIQLHPGYDEVYYNMANIYIEQKKYDQAMAMFDRAIEIKGNYAMAYHNRALLYAMLGENDRAIEDLDKAIALKPDYILAYRNRGYYYVLKGDYERSIEDYSRALELNPDYATVYGERGASYAKLGDYERAIADYMRALRLNLRTAQICNNLGYALYRVGRPEEALEYLTTAAQMDPSFAAAFYNRALVFTALKESDRAVADFSRAIELQPKVVTAYRNRGVIYEQTQRPDLALQDFLKAVEIAPDYALAHHDLGRLYARMGDAARSQQEFAKAASLGLKAPPDSIPPSE
ncbi:MAG: tetratricopeptide repeat protein [Deltaproteobacteria bacterium]